MSILQLNTICKDVERRSLAVEKAYYQIIKEIANLLKTFPTSQLRTHIGVPSEIYSQKFVSSSINIFLSNDCTLITYSKNYDYRDSIGSYAYQELSRIIYRNTMKDNTDVFIEDCLEEQLYNYQELVEAMDKPYAEIIIEEPN
ncbi:MAG TPA: hypothetical protein VGB63_14640 [Pedobacter sp.]|jgi:phosphate uptake regulator